MILKNCYSNTDCLNSFRSFWEKDRQASILRSMAAANATKAAASSEQLTCCALITTSGSLLHFPSPYTMEDITNPWYKSCAHDPDDPTSDQDPEPERKSKLLFRLVIGVALFLISMLNFPPFLVLIVELANVMVSLAPSGMISKR